MFVSGTKEQVHPGGLGWLQDRTSMMLQNGVPKIVSSCLLPLRGSAHCSLRLLLLTAAQHAFMRPKDGVLKIACRAWLLSHRSAHPSRLLLLTVAQDASGPAQRTMRFCDALACALRVLESHSVTGLLHCNQPTVAWTFAESTSQHGMCI